MQKSQTNLRRNNKAMKRSGFCAVCRRAGGEYAGEIAKRGKKSGE